MPMHDWTRVSAGTFHDFHNSWITHLKERLNEGLLPAPYYAPGKQRAGEITPDVLALHSADGDTMETPWSSEKDGQGGGLVAVAEAPPRVQLAQEAIEDLTFYLARQRTLVIRHTSGDRIAAWIEIMSPANKHTPRTLDDFADKVIAALHVGIHVLIIDPYSTHGERPGRNPRSYLALPAGRHVPCTERPTVDACLLRRRPTASRVCRADETEREPYDDAVVPDARPLHQCAARRNLPAGMGRRSATLAASNRGCRRRRLGETLP